MAPLQCYSDISKTDLRTPICQAADLGQYAFLKLLRLFLPSNISRIAVSLNTIYGNENLLVNKQMIKTGISDIPDLPGLKDAITKKQSETEFLNDLKKAQQVYAQSVYQSHSKDSIRNPEQVVKKKLQMSDRDPAVLRRHSSSSVGSRNGRNTPVIPARLSTRTERI